MATLSFNPYLQSSASGSFNTQSDGYIQGIALDDPSVRNYLAGGVLAAAETKPMWGGVGISELIGGEAGSPAAVLGGLIGRATTLTAQAAGQLTGFSVFNQLHSSVSSPQSPVPLAGSGGQVNYYRIGSGARIAVKMSSGLINLQGELITSLVSWDFVNQQLVPYAPAYAANTITGAVWASTSGGRTTYTVSTDPSSTLTAGDVINVSGVVSTGGTGVGYNGQKVVVSTTSSTIVVTDAASASPGTYSSGGQVDAGGGALNVRVLDVQNSNAMTVDYDPVTGFATWNRNGAAALILI